MVRGLDGRTDRHTRMVVYVCSRLRHPPALRLFFDIIRSEDDRAGLFSRSSFCVLLLGVYYSYYFFILLIRSSSEFKFLRVCTCMDVVVVVVVGVHDSHKIISTTQFPQNHHLYIYIQYYYHHSHERHDTDTILNI